MSNILTSSKLIKSIKRRAMLPSDDNTFTDEDFLDMLNEEIQYFGVPHLLRTYEDYLLYTVDLKVNTDTNKYKIPYRAVGNKLRDVAYVDTNGNVFELARISVEDLSDYNQDYVNDYAETFYIQNDKVVIVDQLPDDGTIRMYFYLKPNSLVENEKAGVISNIDRNTGEITLTNFPNTFSNLPKMDFIESKSPNKIYSYDITPTSSNKVTKTVTFDTDDIPSDLAKGDYLNIAQETIVPQLPTELHPILAQRVSVAALEALGDMQGLQIAQQRLQMMEKSANTIIDNRVEGSPEKINNRHSPLREAALSSYRFNRRGRT